MMVLFVSEYTLKVQHIKGFNNVAADFLTRHIDVEADPLEKGMLYFCTSILIYDYQIPTIDGIKVVQKEELETQLLLTVKVYTFRDDTVYYHNLIYVLVSLQGKVIQAYHLIYPINHLSQKKTMKTVNKLLIE